MAPSTPRLARVAIAPRSSRLDTRPKRSPGRWCGRPPRPADPGSTRQRAVLADVGDHVARTPSRSAAFQHIHRSPPSVSSRGRAAGTARSRTGHPADGHLVAVLGDGGGAPLWILQCGGADVDPRATGGQRGPPAICRHGFHRQLDGHIQLTDHLSEQFTVGAASEGRPRPGPPGGSTGAVALPGSARPPVPIRSRSSAGLAPAIFRRTAFAADHVHGRQQDQFVRQRQSPQP